MAILTYHVVPGKADGGRRRRSSTQAKTVRGAALAITAAAARSRSATPTVTATDIMASNGVIHVIDTVVLPPS